MYDVQTPVVEAKLRVKDRFLKRNFFGVLDGFYSAAGHTRSAVVIVSHSGTISNMLFSHTSKEEEQVLKPRNGSVIAIDDTGTLGLRHEGTLPPCKSDEWHEYFTVPQFEEFASGIHFEYTPPPSCLLLLVRHGIAVNNVNKAYTDGNLTREGEVSVIKAALRISHILHQHNIQSVNIFSSACMRTQHSSVLLYEMLRRRQIAASRSLPCLSIGGLLASGGGVGSGVGGSDSNADGGGDEPWLKGAIPVGHQVC